jgi:hypothetical protein
LGGDDAAQRVTDRGMHALKIFQDLVVPKPQNAIALVFAKPGSRRFRRAARLGLNAMT